MTKIPLERVEGSAPFNLALNTLERVAAIIEKLCYVSIQIASTENTNDADLQHIKFALLKQLYIQAVPLLRDNEKKKQAVKKRIDNIKLGFPQPVFNKLGERVGNKPVFDPKIDYEMDEIEIEISETLQSMGYFMPPKNDPRFTFRQ